MNHVKIYFTPRNGKVKFNSDKGAESFLRFLELFDGTSCEMILSVDVTPDLVKLKKYFFVLCGLMAEHSGHTKQEVIDHFKDMFFTRDQYIPEKDHFVKVRRSFNDKDITKEMLNNLVNNVRTELEFHGIKIPEKPPHEQEHHSSD